MHGHPTLVIYNQYYLFQTGTEWVIPHKLEDYTPRPPDGFTSADITMKHEFYDKKIISSNVVLKQTEI